MIQYLKISIVTILIMIKGQYYRWDNAPYHKEIVTFPDHFHNNKEVKESEEVTIEKVFKYIIRFL